VGVNRRACYGQELRQDLIAPGVLHGMGQDRCLGAELVRNEEQRLRRASAGVSFQK